MPGPWKELLDWLAWLPRRFPSVGVVASLWKSSTASTEHQKPVLVAVAAVHGAGGRELFF